MATEVGNYLSTSVVEPLHLVFSPVLDKQDLPEFEGFLDTLCLGKAELDLLRARTQNDVSSHRDAFSAAHVDVVAAQTAFEARRTEIYSPKSNNDLNLVIDRIRVTLSDPNQPLPFYLLPLRRFALRIHPALAPFQEKVRQAEGRRAALKSTLDLETASAEDNARQEQEELEEKLRQTSERIRQFCDAQATRSRTLALDYLVVLPDRVNIVAENYTQQAAQKRHTNEFDEFTAFLRRNHVAEGKIKRIREGSEKDILRRYQDYLRYSLLSECFKRGIIRTKPSIPGSLF